MKYKCGKKELEDEGYDYIEHFYGRKKEEGDED